MSYEVRPNFIGCFVAPIGLIIAIGLVYLGSELWDWLHRYDADAKIAKINRLVADFGCNDLVVTEHVPGSGRSYEGGAYLKMSETCRADLRRAAEDARKWRDLGDNCLMYEGNAYYQLCFEGEQVYFGDIRP